MNKDRVLLFDGQHKVAALLWNGRRDFECKIYLNPDLRLLNETNILAHDTFSQTRFDASGKCLRCLRRLREPTPHPPPHLPNVAVIRRAKLTAHLFFFKGYVDPVQGGEEGYGRNEHRPGAHPDRDAKGDDNEAEVHGVAGKAVGTACEQPAIGR